MVTKKLDQHDGDRQSQTQIKSQTQINFSFIFLYTSATKHFVKVAVKVAGGNYIMSRAENTHCEEILNTNFSFFFFFFIVHQNTCTADLCFAAWFYFLNCPSFLLGSVINIKLIKWTAFFLS